MADLSLLVSIGLVQLLAVISPGPSFLITAQTAVAKSRLAGIKVAFGLAAGTVVWSSMALLGLSALFHAWPLLFMMMKIIGALFILYVAFLIFRHASEPLALTPAAKEQGKLNLNFNLSGNPFLKGFTTQMSNPKAAVFFGSIFVAMLPGQISTATAIALIAIVSFNEVWWYCLVALFFSVAPVRQTYLKAKRWIDRVTGVFLGLLGFRLLWGAFNE